MASWGIEVDYSVPFETTFHLWQKILVGWVTGLSFIWVQRSGGGCERRLSHGEEVNSTTDGGQIRMG